MNVRAPLLAVTLVVAATAAWTDDTPARRGAATPAAKPLYHRLGGVYPIAAVVDAFIERLLVTRAEIVTSGK
jgi:hypothetical protein